MEKQGMLRLLPLLAVLASTPVLAQDDEEFFDFDEVESSVTVPDPLESFNRASFALNDKLYRGFLKPVARGMRVLPVPVRTSLSNFFINLVAPVSAASALLQGDAHNAATEAGRFILNTTAGLGGFLDPATGIGLIQDEEDIGQMLARWGVGHGFYLVVPLYGPTSLRDMAGSIANNKANPLYGNLVTGEIIGINVTGSEILLSLDQDTYEAFYESSLDPYVFFRSAWAQNRQGMIDQ
jgi:phospholipid-binding lipoprotein MlaA